LFPCTADECQKCTMASRRRLSHNISRKPGYERADCADAPMLSLSNAAAINNRIRTGKRIVVSTSSIGLLKSHLVRPSWPAPETRVPPIGRSRNTPHAAGVGSMRVGVGHGLTRPRPFHTCLFNRGRGLGCNPGPTCPSSTISTVRPARSRQSTIAKGIDEPETGQRPKPV
jgi:hypothetical protein